MLNHRIQVHGFPFVACSIGVTIDKQPVVGVIYNPFLDQLYSARTGGGATLNHTVNLPITGSPKPLASLGEALLGVEWGSTRMPPAIGKKADLFKKLAGDPEGVPGGKLAHSLRSLGSAALNICLVASGGLDTFVLEIHLVRKADCADGCYRSP
jgi:myo-inositol-1(or 4)-monophosphatase